MVGTFKIKVEVSSDAIDDVTDDIITGGKIQKLSKKILAFLDDIRD